MTVPVMDDSWFEGRRVTVMGLGRFGGGVGVARWLAARGARVLVTDIEPEADLRASVAALAEEVRRGAVELRLGGHNVSDFTTCDAVVANPAVNRPWDNRFLRAASAAGVPITTEVRLVADRLDRGQVIGVTGSAGKSTTSAMIAHALNACGRRAHLGGNIGGTLLSTIPEIKGGDFVVLELSSFMLHWLGQGRPWSPRVAVITNITDNHADWHGSFQHYAACKLSLFEPQREGDAAVFPGEGALAGPLLDRIRALAGPRARPVSARPVAIALPGAHNVVNACIACEAALAAARGQVPVQDLERALASFSGLPHRLSLAAERAGVKWYNDSKSTTPESTLRAVEAFAGLGLAHVHLIAGGHDKGSNLAPVAGLAPHLGGLYTIGVTGPAIAAGAGGRVIECGTLSRAVEAARGRARPGDIVLLSPACASWDQYENYERRGEEFERLARGGPA
jgi:UDP-N-acetylmuramoylalanine--D-glutamate ligase